ncbi:DUF2057 family protein [Vibrio sp. FF112]|uniref:YccT family protein n=1 Tax=Vibrio sp. FF112 TaxID=3230008 RepID=UPI00352F2869
MMKKVLLALGLLTSVFGSVSAATLTPQKGVSILYINGQAAQNKISENQINEGFNQVLVRFDKKFGNSGVYSSAPYVLNFDVTGEEVEIKSPKVRSYMEAEKIFEAVNPSWVVLQDDVAIKYQQDVIERKPGFAPFGGLESRLAEHNASKAVYFKDGVLLDKPEAVVLASVVGNTTAQTSGKAQKPVKLAETQNVEQLQAWYIKASKQERKEFRKWMIDQE